MARWTPLSRASGVAGPSPSAAGAQSVGHAVGCAGSGAADGRAVLPRGCPHALGRRSAGVDAISRPVILPHAQHVVSYHVVSQGVCWCESPGQTPLRLETGDVLVVPHGHAYQLASACGLRTGWSLDEALGWFRAMAGGQLPFVVTEGGGGPERLQLVCGFLGCDALPFNPVLTTLPALMQVRVHGDSGRSAARAARVRRRGVEPRPPGQPVGAAADRGTRVRRGAAQLLDDGVGRRRELAGRAAGPDRGARAGAPARRTRARLDVAGTRTRGRASRSVLAERFTSFVGHPPMLYLTRWRMQLAASRLAAGAAPVSAVASDVGYESEAAFCRAFKKVTGVTPASWRSRRRVES